MFPVLELVMFVLDLVLNNDPSDRSDVDAPAASVPGLSASLSLFSLSINECLPKVGQQFSLLLLTEGCFSITD